MLNYFGSIEQERQLRISSIDQKGAGSKEAFLSSLKNRLKDQDYARVLDAYEFAISIQYSHEGLDSESYLAHPLRVARVVMELTDPVEVDAVIIALLHNVLEVGTVSSDSLKEKFSDRIVDSIVTLTVDRKQQWDLEYKEQYYRAINHGYVGARIVKVVDKLDNILLLCRNPDDAIREAYLREIDRHVIPMAEEVMLQVASFLKAGSANAKEVGYISKT
jgi:(p)ppGpp synthase/HD superfamily hydrolase